MQLRAACVLAGTALALAGCGSHHRAAPAARPHRHSHPPASPARPRRPGPHDAAVPILEYHVIGDAPSGSPFPGLYVTPADFRAQVDWLAARGWHVVTLDRVLDYWRDGARLPRKPVVLTFDDGYPGDVTFALPILRARGWVGTLNLQVGNLVPARVRQLLEGGWEVDAHTFTHPDLTTVGPARLRHEVTGSRRWIRGVFHAPVDAFAYPDGHYDPAVVAAVRSAGFRAAETENQGWASPRQGLLTLDRIRVVAGESSAGIAAALG